jgi:hypothetical protein
MTDSSNPTSPNRGHITLQSPVPGRFTVPCGALRDPEAKVLVHCHVGIDRGPSMAHACLLMLGRDPIEAMTMIRSARPIAAIGYAEDAPDWHHRTPYRQAHPEACRLAAPRILARGELDRRRPIIREIRATEAA